MCIYILRRLSKVIKCPLKMQNACKNEETNGKALITKIKK